MDKKEWKVELIPKWLTKVLKTNLLIFFIALLLWYCTPNEPKVTYIPVEPTTMTVTATMYEPVPTQTDSTPNITADGTRISIKHAGKYRYLAVSRDLLDVVNYGDYVVVEGINGKYDGVWQVKDTMHPRWTNRVDLLCNPGTLQFKKDSAILKIYK